VQKAKGSEKRFKEHDPTKTANGMKSNRFDLRERLPGGRGPVKGGEGLIEKASHPALDGVAGGERIARKQRFDRTGSREFVGMLAADRLIKSQGSGGIRRFPG